MKKESLQIGKTVFRLNINNAARGGKGILKPVTITKIGNKYFSVKGASEWDITEHHIDSGYEKSNYSPDYLVYETAQEYEDKEEKEELKRKIKEAIQTEPLENLRKIKAIIWG